MAAEVTYDIQPLHNATINIHGWRIVRSDGAVLLPFGTKREAEKLVKFFAPEKLEEELQ